MLTNDKVILGLVRKYAPDDGFNKRAVNVVATERLQLTGQNWSGGYKSEYIAVDLVDGRCVKIPEPVWNAKYQERFVEVVGGLAIVCYDYCGNGKRITIYLHPSNIALMIEPPIELSEEEKIVLYCSRRFKNVYGGRTDIRRKEAASMGYKMTPEEWGLIQQQLQGKGLLNKSNALTMKGRNATPDMMPWKKKV